MEQARGAAVPYLVRHLLESLRLIDGRPSEPLFPSPTDGLPGVPIAEPKAYGYAVPDSLAQPTAQRQLRSLARRQ